MTKARDLANLISTGNPLADGAIAVSEVTGAAPLASPTFTGTVTGPTINASSALQIGGTAITVGASDINTVTAKAPLASPTFTGDVTLPDKIVHTGDTNTAIRFPANDTVAFETGGSERFRFASAGQLGIAGANYGTSGQVLQSGGASGAVSWADAGGGAYEVISDAAYSTATSTITFSVDVDYLYQIEILGLEITAGGSEFQIQASHDSFSNIKIWEWWVIRNNKFGGTNAHTYNEQSYNYARISYGNVSGDTTDAAANALITFGQKTGKYPIHMSEIHNPEPSSFYPQFSRSVGRVRSTDTINQIRLKPNSGQIKASRIRLLRRA